MQRGGTIGKETGCNHWSNRLRAKDLSSEWFPPKENGSVSFRQNFTGIYAYSKQRVIQLLRGRGFDLVERLTNVITWIFILPQIEPKVLLSCTGKRKQERELRTFRIAVPFFRSYDLSDTSSRSIFQPGRYLVQWWGCRETRGDSFAKNSPKSLVNLAFSGGQDCNQTDSVSLVYRIWCRDHD